MSNILATLNYELKKQCMALEHAQIELGKAPRGFLREKKRVKSVGLYHLLQAFWSSISYLQSRGLHSGLTEAVIR